MKICWDNLERLRYSKNTNRWYLGNSILEYMDSCEGCNESFLAYIRKSIDKRFCSVGCKNKTIPVDVSGKNNPMYGKRHTEESIEKIKQNRGSLSGKNNPMYGKKHSEETRKKISFILSDGRMKESGNGMYGKHHSDETKDLIRKKLKKDIIYTDIPLFDGYASQIDWIEEVRRNSIDTKILEVKCTYCGRWYIPKRQDINNRIQLLKGNTEYRGEYHLYCSNGCKKACPIYGKTPNTLMKEDAIRVGRLNWIELNREVQPELRQMVLLRDNYECVKCNNTNELHCHHILPVSTDPLLSADIDNCITLCVKCHKEVHNQDGCKNGELHICI